MSTAKEQCTICLKDLPSMERLRTAHIAECATMNPHLVVEEDIVNHPVVAPEIPTAKYLTVEQLLAPAPTVAEEEPIFSEYGKYVLDAMLRWQPKPVMLIGDSGWGKTYLAKYSASLSNKGFLTINCNEQMNMDSLVGIPAPANGENGIFLEWADGMLTEAIRQGKIFLCEEFTRAPDEIRSNTYNVLDQVARGWTIPQASGITDPNVPVHDDFWFIATANPTGGAYATYQIDPAMDSRLVATYRINQPLADEHAVLLRDAGPSGVLIKATYGSPAKQMSSEDLVSRLLGFAHDQRPTPDVNLENALPFEEPYLTRCLNTRDLRSIMDGLLRGFSPPEVASQVIANKYGEASKGMKLGLVNHFMEGSW